MKLLLLTFIGMAAYGAYTGIWGGFLISVGMIVLMLYAMRVFAQQDLERQTSPLYAVNTPCTLDLLDQQCCESSESRFHASISESE